MFLYNEGIVRFATVKYEGAKKRNIHNLYMHLTNYAINKSSDAFVNSKEGEDDKGANKRTLSSVLQQIEI